MRVCRSWGMPGPVSLTAITNSAFHLCVNPQCTASCADRLESIPNQIALAIRLTTARVPSRSEIEKELTFIQDIRNSENLSSEQAMNIFCLMILNTNEFRFVQ